MKIYVKIFLLVSFLTSALSNSNNEYSLSKSYRFNARKLLADWCSLSCGPGRENIACEMGGKCRARAPCEFDKIDKEKILEAHNKLRNEFAAGKESLSGGITVSNMVALEWDNSLAFTASCNRAKCGPMQHDKCRTTPKFPKYAGQNLWYYGLSVPGGDCIGESIKGVQAWYDEVKLMDAAKIKAMGEKFVFEKGTGHFTQVIWAETTHVGCSLTKNEDGGKTECQMACNYGPGGNMGNAKMFQEGNPCSACPGGLKCGTTLTSLCGEGGVEDDDNDYDDGGVANLRPNIGLMMIFVLLIHMCFSCGK